MSRGATAWLPVLLGLMWLSSQVQRFSLATYLGASPLMVDLGITAAAAGFLASVYYPVYGVVQVPSGILADQGSPRRNLLSGGFLMAASGLAFAVAPNLQTAVAARVAVGLTGGLLYLSILKLTHRGAGRAYARRLSLLMMMGCVGSIAALGGLPVLLDLLPWRLVAALATLPTLVASLLLLRTETPGDEPTAPVAELARRYAAALGRVPAIVRRLDFWVMFLPSMLWTGTQFAVLTWLPRYARDILEMPTAAVGVLPALVPLGQAIGSVGFGYLHSRRPSIGLPLFFGSAVGYALGLALLATGAPSRAGPLAIEALALGIGLLYGSYFVSLAWIGGAVEPGLVGTASGVMNALGFLPAFVLPWAMGGLMDAVDHPTVAGGQYSAGAYSAAFAVTVAALAVGLAGSGLVALLSWRRSRPAQGERREWVR